MGRGRRYEGNKSRKVQQIRAIFKYDGLQERDPFYVSRSVWARSLISSRNRGKPFQLRRVRMLYSTRSQCPCQVHHATFLTSHVIPGTHAAARFTDGAHTYYTHSRTMNSLYTLGVRQSSSIQADLERMRGGDTSASLLGLSLPLTRSDLVTAHSGILYPARADICFARGNEPHDR
jgi:hypothetical protein